MHFLAKTALVRSVEFIMMLSVTPFIGFSSLLPNGIPQMNFFQTDDFNELRSWMEEFYRSEFISLHVVQPLISSVSPFILSAYGTDGRVSATDILQRWLYIFKQCLSQGVRIIGFSTDADPRYLRAMRLCTRFFAKLPQIHVQTVVDLVGTHGCEK